MGCKSESYSDALHNRARERGPAWQRTVAEHPNRRDAALRDSLVFNYADAGGFLAVRYVLEGSVRKASGKVRITGQLIDAATGTHIWADNFERDLTDILLFRTN